MRQLQKHPSKPGVYVGQATGTWHIKRVGKRRDKSWRALKVSGAKFACDPPAITGRTLQEVFEGLLSLNEKIAAELSSNDEALKAVRVEMMRDVRMPNPFGTVGGE